MNESKAACNRAIYKRKRPLLGTFVAITLCGRAERLSSAVDAAYAEMARLERLFTRFSPESELSRFNASPRGQTIAASPDFAAVVSLALDLWRQSEGAFNPFFPATLLPSAKPFVLMRRDGHVHIKRLLDAPLDFSGVAKGYAADRAVMILRRLVPDLAGCVDAGGDLRFFGRGPREAVLRLGSSFRPVHRRVAANAGALATSSPANARESRRSTSRYAARPGRLGRRHAVSVLAPRCALADALTKVGLHAERAIVSRCAVRFGARILAFDVRGRLIESFGGA